MGYNEDVEGFKIWFPETDRVDTRRDVTFRENDRYSAASTEVCEGDESQVFELLEEPAVEPQEPAFEPHEPAMEPRMLEESEGSVIEEESDDDEEWDSADDPFHPEDRESEEENEQVRPPEERVLRNRDFIRRPSRYEDGIHPEAAFLAEGEDPRNYQEAIASPHAAQWKRAMDDEIESLNKNNTWSIVRRQHGAKPV